MTTGRGRLVWLGAAVCRAPTVVFLLGLSQFAGAGSMTNTFDAAGRLIRVVYANGVALAFTYDAAGNRTSRIVASAQIEPATVQVAASRKSHGSAGSFDLTLALAPANPTTEPRSGGAGGNHTVVFRFDKAVTGGTASVTSGTATAGPPTFSGNEMIVPLTGVTNQQYVTVGVSNVAGSDGSTGGSASVRIGFLLGDVSQNRVVTVSDLAQVNAQIAQIVTASNYLKDVNASGTLTVADKAITSSQITKALPVP
jgi:YD repeat-containing protein